jgi:hypothetical protein
VATILAVVAAASALDLAVGAGWAVAALACLWARRRRRTAPLAVLLVVAGTAAVAASLGLLGPASPAPYGPPPGPALEAGAGEGPGRGPGTVEAARDAAWARLAERRREELAGLGPDPEGRVAAAVALARGRATGGPPAGAVRALEAAARTAALTLTAPEFRDLEARRARLQAWLEAVGARLAAARDAAEIQAAVRALEPAAMAPVSLRALREDLARVDAAAWAVVREAGGDLVVAGVALARYEDAGDRLTVERRYTLAARPPASLAWLRVAPAPVDAGPGGAVSLDVVAGEDGRADAAGRLPRGTSRAVVAERRTWAGASGPVRSARRWIAFRRLAVPPAPSGRPPDAPVVLAGVAVDGGGEVAVRVPLPAAALVEARLPPGALYWASRAGTVAAAGQEDRWVAAGEAPAAAGADAVVMDLVPEGLGLRSPALRRLLGSFLGATAGGVLAVVGLAAAAVALAPGRREAVPPGPRDRMPGGAGAAR